MFTLLNRILRPERFGRKLTKAGTFARPLLGTYGVSKEDAPLLVSNTHGNLITPGVSKEGLVRYAFFEAPLEYEESLLSGLIASLREVFVANGWPLYPTVKDAVEGMLLAGVEPRSVVIPASLLAELGEDVDPSSALQLQSKRGYVTMLGLAQVLVTEAPVSFVSAMPALSGVYCRSDDWLGLLFLRVNRSFALVDCDVA